MSRNTIIILSIVIVILILAGALWYTTPTSIAPTALTTPLVQTPLKEADTQLADVDQPTAAPPVYTGTVLAGTTSPLLDFTQADFEAARAANKVVVLYFYANWCPICREEFPKMQTAFNQLSGSEVVGFRVNFNDNQTNDAEKALAREHGVAYQHTKVILRNDTQLLKSPETWEMSRYLTEINKVLGQ